MSTQKFVGELLSIRMFNFLIENFIIILGILIVIFIAKPIVVLVIKLLLILLKALIQIPNILAYIVIWLIALMSRKSNKFVSFLERKVISRNKQYQNSISNLVGKIGQNTTALHAKAKKLSFKVIGLFLVFIIVTFVVEVFILQQVSFDQVERYLIVKWDLV